MNTTSRNHISTNYQFIDESPFNSTKDDPLLFGHDEIVTTLESIVDNSPQSFTIGLFGDWGSGKSSIAGALQEKLAVRRKSLPVVIFDVWKHEGDALRRTFLRHLEKVLKNGIGVERKKFLASDYTLDKRIDSEVVTSIESVGKFSPSMIPGLIIPYLIPLVFGLLLWLILDKALGLHDFKLESIKDYALILLSLFPVSFLIEKFINRGVTKIQIEERQDKLQDPIDFENLFKDILTHLKSDKLTIVFDNLDRVSGEKAVEIISTIKTFFETADREVDLEIGKKKDVVFIIPCDVLAIKNHLKKVFQYEIDTNNNSSHSSYDVKKYADEYLRKFFNTVIRIPDFYETELEDFARGKLRQTKIAEFDNDDLAALITEAFSQNPRQIIQFVNTLIASYILLKERQETNSGIPKGFIEKRTAQLAKFNLLLRKFPEIMEIMRNNKMYDLEGLDHSRFLNIDTQELQTFQNFLQYTSWVRIDPSETLVFFKLRKTPQERKFPKIERLYRIIQGEGIKSIINGKEDSEDDKRFIEKFDFKNNIHDFSDVIKQQLKSTTNPILKCKFLGGVLYLLDYLGISLSKQAYIEVESALRSSVNGIHLIEQKVLMNQVMKKDFIKPHVKKVILNQWFKLFNDYSNVPEKEYDISEDYIRELLINIKGLAYETYVTSAHRKNFADLIADSFSEDTHVATLFVEPDDIQKDFINSRFIKDFIETLTDEDFADTQDLRGQIIKKFLTSKFDEVSAIALLQKLVNLIVSENESENYDFEDEKGIYEFCAKMLAKIRAKLLSSKEATSVLGSLTQSLISDDDPVIDWSAYWNRVPILLELEEYHEDVAADANDYKIRFLKETDSENLNSLLQKTSEQERLINSAGSWDVIKARLVQGNLDFDMIFVLLDVVQQRELFNGLIANKEFDVLLEKLTEFQSDVEDKFDLVSKVFAATKDEDLEPNQLEKLFELTNDLNLDAENFDFSFYKDKVSYLVSSADPQEQSVGIKHLDLSTYLTSEEKHEILKSTSCVFLEDLNNYSENLVKLQDSKAFPTILTNDVVTLYQPELLEYLFDDDNSDEFDELFEFLGSNIPDQAFGELLSKIIEQLNSNSSSIVNYFDLLKSVKNAITKESYSIAKDEINELIEHLLNSEEKSESFLDLLSDFLQKAKVFTKNRIRGEVIAKVDALYYSTDDIDLREILDEFLSTDGSNGKLQITTAMLHVEGKKNRNYAAAFQAMVKGSKLQLTLSNEGLHEVNIDIKGKIKGITIEFSYRGEEYESKWDENEEIYLP